MNKQQWEMREAGRVGAGASVRGTQQDRGWGREGHGRLVKGSGGTAAEGAGLWAGRGVSAAYPGPWAPFLISTAGVKTGPHTVRYAPDKQADVYQFGLWAAGAAGQGGRGGA